jgi:uncharacterized membrane protein YqiK
MGTNWSRLKKEYITGTMSIRELAEKRGVNVSTAQTRASHEGWMAERKAYKQDFDEKSTKKIAEKKAEKEAEAWAQIDDLKKQAVIKALNIVNHRLNIVDENTDNADVRRLVQSTIDLYNVDVKTTIDNDSQIEDELSKSLRELGESLK